MQNLNTVPPEIKILFNHIYEYKKGIRSMVLYTINKTYETIATQRLENQQIPYLIQDIGKRAVNIFFGKPECIEAIRMVVNRPLNQLTPEEDFILGAILGYGIRLQCKRFCTRKNKTTKNVNTTLYSQQAKTG
ncbi:MAG: DUF2023 family protein [Tannerella sp.]|nr:DUF2023 family protein [Tannerella sp.]